MGDNESPHITDVESIVADLEREIQKLYDQNVKLRNENESLKERLHATTTNGDLFADLSVNDKAAMRQRVQSLINKIDQHLGGEA